MALPTPSTPLVIPSMETVRGNQKIDERTKSSITDPVTFTVKNVCDADAYFKFNISANINELTEDCELVQAGNISIKGQVPHPGNAVDVSAIINLVRDELVSSLT